MDMKTTELDSRKKMQGCTKKTPSNIKKKEHNLI